MFAPAQQAGYPVSEISFNLSLYLKSLYVSEQEESGLGESLNLGLESQGKENI